MHDSLLKSCIKIQYSLEQSLGRFLQVYTNLSRLSLRFHMSKIQLFFHHVFRFIWNGIFILSYPILASFGLLFIGLTFLFSKLSQLLTHLKPDSKSGVVVETAWETLSNSNDLLESKVEKQILFGPVGVRLRRKDGVPTVLSEHVFGKKVRLIEKGYILEKWNTLE